MIKYFRHNSRPRVMRSRKQGGILTFSHRLANSAFLFPLVLFALLTLLTLFKISGSSVGIYHVMLNGETAHDSNLIYGSPKLIRYDEWLGWTQLSVAQSKENFPEINQNIGPGKDLSLQLELPTTEWSTAFRPQNWSFFFMPFENAFAFKWWLLFFLLAVSVYFFTLRIFPDRRLLASIISLAFTISPFILWWYQTAVLGLLAYGFFIIILSQRISNNEPLRWIKSTMVSRAIYTLLLAFLFICFGLTLYPPFQISIALIVALYILGTFLNDLSAKKNFRKVFLNFVPILLAAMVAICLGLAFINSNKEIVDTLNSTVYPGKRVVESGGYKVTDLLNGQTMYFLQNNARAMAAHVNQSEASNFILLAPFLIIPSLILFFYEYRKKNRIDWVFLLVSLGISVYIARLFITFGDPIYKLLLLDKVPHVRLIIGLGFAGIILFILLMKKIADLDLSIRKVFIPAALYSAFCLTVVLWASYAIRESYPLLISRQLILILLSLALALVIALLLTKKPLASAFVFLVLSIASSYSILPLYKGVGILKNSPLISAIENGSSDSQTWATADDVIYENFGLVAGKNSFSGVQIYPNTNYWKSIVGEDFSYVYNRNAHMVISSQLNESNEKLKLIAQNQFHYNFQCQAGIADRILSTRPLNYSCLKLIDRVSYPKTTFYIYEYVQAGR